VKRLDILDLPDGARELVGECEVTGKQTFFERNGRPVAVLASYDEYMALTETVAIAADPVLREKIDAAEAMVGGNRMMLVEELFEGS
jgi:PHD/YefM family antitoxin component YafN of YafNO toxin-antitoxin module